jgi:hypothetical protein
MAKYVPSPRDWVREQVELYENSGGTEGTTLREPQEREHYARLRNAWITLAKRCEPFNFPAVTDSEKF